MIFPTSLRVRDTKGKTPLGNVAVHQMKSLTKEHNPYIAVGDGIFGYTVEFNVHFIKNVRRVMSGDTADTRFSDAERLLYIDFIDYEDGKTDFSEERSAVLEALDDWLVNQVANDINYKMGRNKSAENPWITLNNQYGVE